MTENSDELNCQDDAEGALSTVGDSLGDLVTGIPAPIRKNAAKAFARLCTAAVEYPVALIEGAIAEKRAETRARVTLIDSSARQLADQMQTNPEYARAAASKFAHKIIRERVNIDQISRIAAENLRSLPKDEKEQKEEAPPISEDWLNTFENEAARMSSDEMQQIFGRILAGEIQRPASYSIKTIRIMSQLDNRAASLFRQLCSCSVSLRVPDSSAVIDARVVSMGVAGSNSLQAYGLSFDCLNILHEYGLIISDYNSYMDYQMASVVAGRVGIALHHQGSKWVFVPKEPTSESREIRVEGVGFSRSGKELLSLVEVEPNAKYTEALTFYFEARGMVLTKIV